MRYLILLVLMSGCSTAVLYPKPTQWRVQTIDGHHATEKEVASLNRCVMAYNNANACYELNGFEFVQVEDES